MIDGIIYGVWPVVGGVFFWDGRLYLLHLHEQQAVCTL